MPVKNLFLFVVSIVLSGCSTNAVTVDAEKETSTVVRPNFLIITTDDMGYTDLGAFGGNDLSTPNLDSLAMQGIRLTNFHTSISCAPTRSMLMSGTGNHEAGLGVQRSSEFDGQIGYERHITDRVLTLPERMRSAGYHTYMAGKWHLGNIPGSTLPGDRGFDRSFAQLPGGFDHFKIGENDELPSVGNLLQVPYTEDGELVESLPDDFYSTNAFVGKMLTYLQESAADDQPFFAWFAPTAPHWPLQVHPEWLGKMRGKYDAGYDALCAARQQAALELGVLPDGADLSICPELATPWQELSADEQALNSRVMELYAEMVAHLDTEFGRIIDYLEESGQLANTYIIYHNDNGPENAQIFDNRSGLSRFNNDIDNLGKRDSWSNVGQGWADALSAPFRENKGSQYEGGTRVAAFINPPASDVSGRLSQSFLSVMDVMPTIMELAGIEEISVNAEGNTVLPIRGKSFARILQDTNAVIHDANDVIALDMAGDSVLIQGDWKIVRSSRSNDWGLFNVSNDPSETNDLSFERPDILSDLVAKYQQHAAATGILRSPIAPNAMGGMGGMGGI